MARQKLRRGFWSSVHHSLWEGKCESTAETDRTPAWMLGVVLCCVPWFLGHLISVLCSGRKPLLRHRGGGAWIRPSTGNTSGSLEPCPDLHAGCASLGGRWSSTLEECHCGQVPSVWQHSTPRGKTENMFSDAKSPPRHDERTSLEKGVVPIREYGPSAHWEDIWLFQQWRKMKSTSP